MARKSEQLDTGDLGEPFDPASLVGDGNGSRGGDGPNSGTGDDFTFDPERHIGPDRRNADGSFRRKRVGSGKRGPRKQTASALDLGVVSQTLLFWHGVAAGALKAPELSLDEDEAKLLGKALLQVEQQFPTKIDPRMIALANLAGSLGIVYGPRIVAIRLRVAEERKAKKPKADVLPFTNFTPNPSGAA